MSHAWPSRKVGSLGQLLEAAAALPRRPTLACAAAADVALLRAVQSARSIGIVDVVLIGDRARTRRLARTADIALTGISLENEPDPVEASRKAVDLCRRGEAQALMKGNVQTSVLLGEILSAQHGLKRTGVLSHATVFEHPTEARLMLLSDAGVNIAPDAGRKLEMIRNTVWLAWRLGIRTPKVALLAAVETVRREMPATLDAAEVVRLVGEQSWSKAAVVGGPYSLDVAVSRAAASHKTFKDKVAGRADILIAPDIEAGNVLYKALTCFAHLELASVVLGAGVPLVVASRADSDRTKLYSIALAMLAA